MSFEAAILDIAKEYDSFYLYDESRILADTRRLARDFEGIELLYSVKCNPHPLVAETVFNQGFGADAASAGEVFMAQNAGLKAEKIYYSAPGKTRRDIESAIGCATLIADSVGEVERIQQVAAERGLYISIGLRIAPSFSFDGGATIPSKFGIEEARALELLKKWSFPNLEVTGLHVHLQSQELDSEVISGYYTRMFALTTRFLQVLGTQLEYVNFGSGLGIPYSANDEQLNTIRLGDLLRRGLSELRVQAPHIRILVESGRFAVGKCGTYVTTVVDRKTSYGKTFLILKNTLNGFLRPALAQFLENQCAAPSPCEPLYTCRNAFPIRTLKQADKREIVTLAGNLCTSSDIIARDISLPPLSVGDLVLIENAGSYAATLSPSRFSSNEPPAEVFLKSDETWSLEQEILA